MKASKVSPPTFPVSRSLRMLQTNLLLAANPKLTNAFFSSTGSTMPLPSLSKISKACLISLTSSAEQLSLTQLFAFHSFLVDLTSCPFLAGGWFLAQAGAGAFPLGTLIQRIIIKIYQSCLYIFSCYSISNPKNHLFLQKLTILGSVIIKITIKLLYSHHSHLLVILLLYLIMQTRFTVEREHHLKTIITTLKNAYDKENTPYLYLESRAQQILNGFLHQSQLFSAGFSKIFSHQSPPSEDIDRIVLVTVLGHQAITELQRYWHLFKQISVINLVLSGQETKELIRVSPLKKKLKGFIEISLNFFPFIDSVYYANQIKKDNSKEEITSFEESLTSFLLSLPKFHQFHFVLPKSNSSNTLGQTIKHHLQQKLSVLESHKCKQYSSLSSARIKVLVLQRKIDQMSPLVYSYHYGPISKQIQAFQHRNIKFTTHSTLFNALYSLDIQQADSFLRNVTCEKAQNQKVKFQLHETQKAKKAITQHYDEHSSPQQIDMHLSILKSVIQFCERRTYTTALEQTIINALSENNGKMSASRVIDFVAEWAQIPIEKFKPSQDDYIKIVILSHMVNTFWFWHRRILNASLEQPHKDKVINFCRKVEGKFKPLKEKPQGEKRLDLYRHQPLIVETMRQWIQKKDPEKFIDYAINQSSINRQSKLIIAVKGPLGYGELALLLRQLKQIGKGSECLIFCSSLVTTKDYLRIIMRQQIQK